MSVFFLVFCLCVSLFSFFSVFSFPFLVRFSGFPFASFQSSWFLPLPLHSSVLSFFFSLSPFLFYLFLFCPLFHILFSYQWNPGILIEISIPKNSFLEEIFSKKINSFFSKTSNFKIVFVIFGFNLILISEAITFRIFKKGQTEKVVTPLSHDCSFTIYAKDGVSEFVEIFVKMLLLKPKLISVKDRKQEKGKRNEKKDVKQQKCKKGKKCKNRK